MKHFAASLTFSVIMIVIAVVHMTYPSLAIDATFVTLLVIATLPWLAPILESLRPILKSLELPGVRIEFAELEKAKEEADQVGLLVQPEPTTPQPAYLSVAEADPNLALAGLRIEIERRLRAMAQAKGVQNVDHQSSGQLMLSLRRFNVLSSQEFNVLGELLGLLNRAVHGADVDRNAARWAIEVGPRLLAALDQRI
jgi:hypothetical protein